MTELLLLLGVGPPYYALFSLEPRRVEIIDHIIDS